LITSAQQIISTGGGNASSSGGSVSFSIGQIAYTTVSGIAGSVSQGAQQAFEIFSVGSNETALNISLIAFPNPTADNLTLQISNYKKKKEVIFRDKFPHLVINLQAYVFKPIRIFLGENTSLSSIN
jgi:hypothetical protein